MRWIRKAALVVLVVSLVCIVILVGRSAKPVAGQDKAVMLQKVKESPDLEINFTNFAGVPMIIERATTKEISASEYEQLTGNRSPVSRFAAFPAVRLRNGAKEPVTSLTVMVGNRRTSKNYSMKFFTVNIQPGENFLIASGQWFPERVSGTDNDAATKGAPKIVDFDSDRMWWPGGASASDLVLRIVRVQFKSGAHWLIDSASGGDSW